MLAKKQVIAKSRRGEIVIGWVITSITLAFCLEAEIYTLDPIEESSPLDLNSFLAHKFINIIIRTEYYLMTRK